MSQSVASLVPFSHFSQLCEKMTKAPTKDKRNEQLNKFIDHFREVFKKKHGTKKTDDSFFPILRLLLPNLDRDRGAYGIKEKLLANLYIKILCLNKDSSDAQRLMNYRLPKTSSVAAGDFAEVAYYVLVNRCPTEGKMTVQEVNDCLDALSSREKPEVERQLQDLLRNLSSLEQKWLIRIILKEVRLGVGHTSILKAFHPDAKDLYDVTSSLRKVCETLRDPTIRLHEAEISLNVAFRPMLAERGEIAKIDKALVNIPFYIEQKFDGERIQLHKDGNKFCFFSRNGYDYTKQFGADKNSGSFTPYVVSLFNSDIENCILDGEMVAWHKKKGCCTSKGENMDVKNLKDDSAHQPCYFVFDILLKNGRVVTNLPMKERMKNLEGLFTELEGRLYLSTKKEGSAREDIIQALNDAIDERQEGVMVKDPLSIYKPSSRKGGWLKIKPEYTDELMDQLDLLIIGGYYGKGRRKRVVSHFLLGLAVDPTHEGTKPKIFHSVGRVGSGYTMQELEELGQKLEKHWQDTARVSSSIVWTKEKPDMWIEPCNSIIVQVKACEINKTDLYKVGYTLRFPRVEKVRYDKAWHECMTVTDFHKLRMQAEGKLSSRHLTASALDAQVSPRKRVNAINRSLATHFKGADVSSLKKESNIFTGKEFMVVNGNDDHSKQDLEKMIATGGGTFVQNPGSNTFAIIAHKVNIRVRNLMSAGNYNIVRVSWLMKSVENCQVLQWSPMDLIFATPETEKKMLQDFDECGDSYTEDATMESLQFALQNASKKPRIEPLSSKEIAELEEELFDEPSPYGIFRLCHIYFQKPVNARLRSLAEFYGATILDSTLSATHVVCSERDMSHVEEMKALNRTMQRNRFHLVTESWIDASIERGQTRHPDDFAV